MPRNQQIVLDNRPHGEAVASNFKLVAVDTPELKDGEVLVRHHFLSLDPYMRGRMNDSKSYAASQPLREQLLRFTRQKMRLMSDASFIDLSRVAIAELVHAPERARAMMEKLAEKEEGLATWIRAAQARALRLALGGPLRPLRRACPSSLAAPFVMSSAIWPRLVRWGLP